MDRGGPTLGRVANDLPTLKEVASFACLPQVLITSRILDQQAHLWAFVDNFFLFGLLALGGIPLIFFLKRVQHAKKPASAGH